MSTDTFVELPPDSTGKRMRTINYTIGGNSVYSEVVHLADPNTPANLAAVNASGQQIFSQGWNAGRTLVVITLDDAAGITTEALASALIVNKGGTVTTGNTSYTVTSGKTLRIQSIIGSVANTSNTAVKGRLRVRNAPSSISVTSPIIANLEIPSIAAVANVGNVVDLHIPDGLEVTGQIAVSHIETSTSSVVSICIIGFEY